MPMVAPFGHPLPPPSPPPPSPPTRSDEGDGNRLEAKRIARKHGRGRLAPDVRRRHRRRRKVKERSNSDSEMPRERKREREGERLQEVREKTEEGL